MSVNGTARYCLSKKKQEKYARKTNNTKDKYLSIEYFNTNQEYNLIDINVTRKEKTIKLEVK